MNCVHSLANAPDMETALSHLRVLQHAPRETTLVPAVQALLHRMASHEFCADLDPDTATSVLYMCMKLLGRSKDSLKMFREPPCGVGCIRANPVVRRSKSRPLPKTREASLIASSSFHDVRDMGP